VGGIGIDVELLLVLVTLCVEFNSLTGRVSYIGGVVRAISNSAKDMRRDEAAGVVVGGGLIDQCVECRLEAELTLTSVVVLMIKRTPGRLAEVITVFGAIGDGAKEVGRDDEAAVGRHVESEVEGKILLRVD